MTPIVMPDAGTNSDHVEVSAWLVQTGDSVTVGDRVVEVVTSGVTFDITTDVSGLVTKIDAAVGTAVEVGLVLGWIDEQAVSP